MEASRDAPIFVVIALTISVMMASISVVVSTVVVVFTKVSFEQVTQVPRGGQLRSEIMRVALAILDLIAFSGVLQDVAVLDPVVEI